MGNSLSSLVLTPRDILPSLSTVSITTLRPSSHSYLSGYARATLLSVLENAITVGSLTISENGNIKCFGQHLDEVKDGKHVHLDIHSEDFWWRILMLV